MNAVNASDDRIERLGRELDLGEALLRTERKQAEQALIDVHRSLGIAQQHVVERDREIAERNRRIESLLQRLEAIEGSITWRLARRLRDALAGFPMLHRITRALVSIVYRVAARTPEPLRPAAGPRDVASGSEKAAEDRPQDDMRVRKREEPAFGWLGGERIQVDSSYAPGSIAQAAASEAGPSDPDPIAFRAATDGPAGALSTLRAVAPTELIAEVFRSVRTDPGIADSSRRPQYSIVTVVDSDTPFLRDCAASVRAAIDRAGEAGRRRIEWLIVNDEPGLGPETLAMQLGEGLQNAVRILHDGERHGMAARLNQACEASGSEWLLLLRSNDRIESHAIPVIDGYIARLPKCRYISSCALDVDKSGAPVGVRPCLDPTRLFEKDGILGRLTAVRRDLVRSLGGWRTEHSPCHDYDLALRAALQEPLLCIPDYLSRSRLQQHAERQSMHRTGVLRDFLRTLADQRFDAGPGPVADLRRTGLTSGLCLIRSQGRRLEFLEEAILSVRDQTVPVTPCVVVHGTEDATDQVRRHLADRNVEAVVITAPDQSRKRGYPLNVGLDWLRRRSQDFDFFLFLDDDDVLYPFFAARLVELLDLTGADVGVADANCRVPWQPAMRSHNLKPVCALLAGNFMPIHSFIMRTTLLDHDELRFDEEVDYLEDWDFLVSVYATGATFRLLPETLCEFRIIGDGSTPEKNRPIHFEFCRRQILARATDVASRMGPGRFLRDLAEFDFSERPPLTAYELAHLATTRSLFRADALETGQ